MTDKELHLLIERYFEAETSIAEERELRKALASHSAPVGTDPLIDEAKAVMGVTAVISEPQSAISARPPRKTRRLAHPVWWQSAAAVAIIAILVTGIIHINRSAPRGECVAYLNGREISDRDAVMNMMFSDLSEMEAASASLQNEISDDFSDIAIAFEDID